MRLPCKPSKWISPASHSEKDTRFPSGRSVQPRVLLQLPSGFRLSAPEVSQSTFIAGSDVDIAVVAQTIDADPTVARRVCCIDDGMASKCCPCTHHQRSDNKVHGQASQIQA